MPASLKNPLHLMKFFRRQIAIGILLGVTASLPVAFLFPAGREIQKEISRVGAIIPVRATSDNLLSASVTAREVIGFYPYWNLKKIDEVDISGLTTLYYFAVDLNADGTFNRDDPGWPRIKSTEFSKLREKVKASGARLGVTIVNLDADKITQNINNPNHQKTIIRNTLRLMKEEGFTDLNIDLEYVGIPDEKLTSHFTEFVRKLSQSVYQEIPGSKVSIDFFADSVIKPRIFDMKAIGEIVDHVIIMGYDFNRTSSLRAGPVAPLFGKEKYNYDVFSSVTDYLRMVPPEKIILGVPFYGYEWPTQDKEKNAFVIYSSHGPEISTYDRSLKTAQANDVSINFDDESKSAWFAYFHKQSRSWRQVWFENERSLGLKFDLVNQASLAGVAIFALGYDGKESEPLWEVIRQKLR